MPSSTRRPARRRLHRPLALAAAAVVLGALTQPSLATAAPASELPPDGPAACAPPNHDPAVIKELYRIGVEREISYKVMLAMFEAGWVESHMNNLDCGDADSVGVFQQRPSQGWCDPAALCQDVEHATNRFLNAAESKEPECGSGCSAGELAYRVQLCDADLRGRYDENESKARALIEEAKDLQGPAPQPPVAGAAGGSGTTFQSTFYSFFRRADNRALRHTYTPNVGWADHDMAGSIVSSPSTIVFRDDLWVFSRDGDNRLTYRVHDGSAWSDWMWKPGAISGAPATGALGDRMFVVGRTGTALKYRYYDLATGWNASDEWLGLGQPSAGVNAVTDPVIGILGDKLVVAVRGSDGSVWLRMARGGATPQWFGWNRLGDATAAGNPALVTAGNQLHVIFRTPAGEMRYHSYVDGASNWILNRGLGSAPEGSFTGSPAAISFSGLLTVYARNSAGQLLYRELRGSTWSAWLQLGRPGEVNLDSSPVAMRNGGTRYVAARAANQLLYTRAFRTDTGWGSWTSHPGNLAPMP